jgi:membrane protease YdiL (CAAX protease family)
MTSLAFAAIHAFVPGQNAMGFVSMGVFGLAMCAAVRRFGALWWAVGFHAGWDIMLTAIFGSGAGGEERVMWRASPQGPAWLSGGPAGPEASVVTLAMLGLLLWALAWRGQRRR